MLLHIVVPPVAQGQLQLQQLWHVRCQSYAMYGFVNRFAQSYLQACPVGLAPSC